MLNRTTHLAIGLWLASPVVRRTRRLEVRSWLLMVRVQPVEPRLSRRKRVSRSRAHAVQHTLQRPAQTQQTLVSSQPIASRNTARQLAPERDQPVAQHPRGEQVAFAYAQRTQRADAMPVPPTSLQTPLQRLAAVVHDDVWVETKARSGFE